MKACPFCAEDVQEVAVKCKHCGSWIDGRDQSALAPLQPVAPVVQALTQPIPEKGTAALLALVLGGLGAHKFYMNRAGAGLLYLLFCWTFIPGIIAFFEGLAYAFESQEAWRSRFGVYSPVPPASTPAVAQPMAPGTKVFLGICLATLAMILVYGIAVSV